MHPPAALRDNVRSRFTRAAGQILAGRLRLIGDLTEEEFERGKSDCGVVLVDFDCPGLLGIAVLRKRKCRFAASFQADTVMEWNAPAPALTLDQSSAYIQDFVNRCEAALFHGERSNGIVTLTDSVMARAAVKAFHPHREDA